MKILWKLKKAFVKEILIEIKGDQAPLQYMSHHSAESWKKSSM